MSFGTGLFVLNEARTALTFTIDVFNIDITGTQTADINDNLTAAHIHAGPTAVPGSNAGVVFGFFGTPFNNTNPGRRHRHGVRQRRRRNLHGHMERA